jgi:hypothetical protein
MFAIFTCFIVLFPLTVDLSMFAAKLWVYPITNCSVAIVTVALAIPSEKEFIIRGSRKGSEGTSERF